MDVLPNTWKFTYGKKIIFLHTYFLHVYFNGFTDGRLALVRKMIVGHQHIGLRKVGRHVSFWNFIGYNNEFFGGPQNSIVITVEIDNIQFDQPLFRHIR